MSTREHETAVREAAQKLQTAIADAVAAGLKVTWPATAAGLSALVINETAAAKPVEPQAQPAAAESSPPAPPPQRPFRKA